MYTLYMYHVSVSAYVYIYIYIYSTPEIDRISDIFKKDFQKKKLEYFQNPVFYAFFVPLKVIFRSFWTRVWRNFEKMEKSKKNDR